MKRILTLALAITLFASCEETTEQQMDRLNSEMAVLIEKEHHLKDSIKTANKYDYHYDKYLTLLNESNMRADSLSKLQKAAIKRYYSTNIYKEKYLKEVDRLTELINKEILGDQEYKMHQEKVWLTDKEIDENPEIRELDRIINIKWDKYEQLERTTHE